jgi:glycosyltransferase involved in cell wall biosynthesis
MRREIRALEAQGARVVRVAARRFKGPLVESVDRQELRLTRYTTESLFTALRCLAVVALTRPLRLARALLDALTIGARTRPGVWKHLMYVGEACVLLRLARHCEHIHANFGNATSIAVMSRVLGGPAVSLRIHGPEEIDTFTAGEWEWKLRHSAFVAPISDYGVRRVCELVAPRHHHRIKRLRCGVDSALLHRVSAATLRVPAWHRLVCVARLEPRKGHAVLLEAVAALRRDGLHVSLLLIGDGSLRASLENRTRELSISDAVEFAGWQDGAQVLDAVERSRIVVLPSYAEGLPIVLMEAFALGRAVVSTRIAGIPELVVPTTSGWLVDCGDPTALAGALRAALLSADEDLIAMGQAGQRRVREQHNVDMLMRDLLGHVRGRRNGG